MDSVRLTRGSWSLIAGGSFAEGIHLVSGDVGSGKSSLAVILAGLARPESGSISSEGIFSRMVSFQFPEYHVTGSTVREEYRSWGLDPAGICPDPVLRGKEERPPLSLSRGEMKRLVLSCILSRHDDLLVLDEPFSSLDVAEKQRICDRISGRQSGITIIFTHEQEVFPRVDFIWEICGGQLVFRGKVPDAILRWQHAPALLKELIARGKLPRNISPADLREAACRT